MREPWWGSGVAARLHALVIEEAARQGYGSMRLLTPRGQARARGFYEREGWSTDGVPIFEPLLGIDLLLTTARPARIHRPCCAAVTKTRRSSPIAPRR